MHRFLIPLFVLLSSATAHAAPGPRVTSPDGTLVVELATDNDGRPSYAVSRKGQPVIAPSRLGFLLLDAPKFERNIEIVQPRTRTFDETWEQPWGERRFIRNHYNELTVTLKEKARPFRRFDVVFRVFDDGVGFRYRFPEQPGLEQVKISEELTEFSLARDATAWWIPAGEWNREEYLYHRTPVQQVGDAQTPITFRFGDGTHLSIHEAALVDYSGMNLTRVEDRKLKADLTPGIGEGKVVRAAPFDTPWRTLLLSDDAAGLAMSSLTLNLNEPNALGDVSWVTPMKYVGVWWEMHLDLKSWASGPKHGATNENVRKHIDFAAKHGFGGVLVEGWNVGWDGDWFGNGEDFSFTRSYPDFDLEALSRYARSKGVVLIGHHETSGNAAHYEEQLGDAFDLYQRVGVPAVKTGYVADASQAKVTGADGQRHYAWHEGQDMARHHLKVVTEAAKRHIAVNPHEPIKDSGLRRTYPNWITREGARGMEFSAWGQPGNPPEHEANLVFTRLLAGPMDYTPGIFGMKTRSTDGIATTWAKQLSLYVVIYSPLQMAADLLENYEKNPAPFQFIKDVPVDWDDTRVLNGEVGDYVTIARKERGGDNWYLGALTDEDGRTLSVPLSFLEQGRRYTAQIYRDGDQAHWKTAPQDIVIEERTVTRADTLTLKLAPGGGQAIRFVAQ
ncbi:glycoside hydrolase family 97 protein [Pseudoxanthomonas sp. F37]|uniref:glycoside hydrolase family 97 protein n=1 Tax=Pseudoxanthomonas TaxID=83618 RepID=UPI001FD56E39|nr:MULTISPECIES: glycoside hydrolase family 97 protein [Pseudoxanthomonas]UOV04689.1 glycoside hydrolase family 97 protein [Pseudoxanthomonas mexicana]UOV09702.1 glycoside hydrolase family 97 protein [Pseudoxanthomonas sp. F37]